jgi:alpha-ribazole phosphatase/probable phosphoglycerate mutase
MKLKELLGEKQFDVVFCSDLRRAVRSAHLAFDGVAPIILDSRLRECHYGEYNGKPSSIVEPLQEVHIHDRFPGGESYDDVASRMKDFLSFLRGHYPGMRVAIVAHKAPQLALDVVLSGKTWEEAFASDWRKTKSWQPGWKYTL